MRRSVRNVLIVGAVVASTLAASSAWALPYFAADSNRLIGDPRRGTDEDFWNGVNPIGINQGHYASPRELSGGPVAGPGSVAGHIESIMLGGGAGGSVGINVPQPMQQTGAVGAGVDPRTALVNPTAVFAGYAANAQGMFAVRNGAAVQWQTVADGSPIALLPLGSVSGQAFGITPNYTRAVVVGKDTAGGIAVANPINSGLSPGSFKEGGPISFGDNVPWLESLGDPSTLVTGFSLTPWDTTTVLTGVDPLTGVPNLPILTSAGATPQQALDALVGRLNVYEGGALYDPVVGSHNEYNFNHSGGTHGLAGDELNDAVDGTLLLSGTLENMTIQNVWTAPKKGTAQVDIDNDGDLDSVWVADATRIRRTITINGTIWWRKYDQNGNITSMWDILTNNEDPAVMQHFVDPQSGIAFDYVVGSFSASYTTTPFTNTTGANGDGIYDFLGDARSSYSADASFVVPVPEPLTVLCSVLAMGGLGAYARRRTVTA